MGILRNVLYAVIIAAGYSLAMVIAGRFNAGFLPAYIMIGACLSFFGWGGERLWHATLKNFFHCPFAWYVAPTHLPLWGMMGGIGYTIAILTAKKIGVYPVDEIPVKDFFLTGASLGCMIQSGLYALDLKIKQLQQQTTN